MNKTPLVSLQAYKAFQFQLMIIRRVIKVTKRQNGLPSRQQGEETSNGKVNRDAVNAKHNPKRNAKWNPINNPINNAKVKERAR